MELFSIIYRTIFFYFFITICYRIMGKREVGQLGIIDLIISILIAEMVAISIENIKQSIFMTIVPIILLVGIELVLGFISLKNQKIRTILDGKPSLIISNGKINYHEMIKQRYTMDDLLLSLRQKEIRNLEDVEYAFLEPNGKLSIFKYNFMKLKGYYPMPIIIDGVIQYKSLGQIKKNKAWLDEELNKRNLTSKDIFYAFYKYNKIFLIKKSDIK
ncbi:MAG: DUF421 domain-containing protein [Bacilli bacterium]|nr:DUF421 domain-containing protein [Bacilli bacterium]